MPDFRIARVRSRVLAGAAMAPVLLFPAVAWADCTASGTTVTCTGTSSAYSNTASGLTVTADSTATVTGPLVVGDSASITNAGTITGAAASFSLQAGDNATIVNNGTISAGGTTSGAGAILVGNNATITNNGSLYAYSGTPAIQFGANGLFTNSSSATTAIGGNIVFGDSQGSDVSRFVNQSTTYGLVGNIIATGNLSIDNAGIYTGNLTQSVGAGTGAVKFVNESAGTYTGVITTADATDIENAGTMTLSNATAIGAAGTLTSLLANAGTLNIGTSSVASKITVNGNFTQSSAGTLNIYILSAGTTGAVAGTNYGQIVTTGTAALDGTLNLTVAAGYYANGSTYDVIVASGGITGNFATVNNSSLPFLTFVNDGIVTQSDGSQAYQFTVERTSTYAAALAGVANAHQLIMATAIQPFANTAAANLTSDVATVVGDIDVLTTTQALAFLDSVSPEGYAAYAHALHDQANTFSRQVFLRMGDHSGSGPQDGWWGSFNGQTQFGGASGYGTKSRQIGLTAGYDFSDANHVVGLAANIGWDKQTWAPGYLDGTNHFYGLMAYGAQKLGPLRLSAQLGYDFGKLKSSKTIELGSTTRTATADASEHLLKATATLGVPLNMGGISLEPFAGIDFMHGKINGFTETGADTLDLTVSAINANRTDLLAGAELTRSTGMWRPYARVAYRSRLSGSGSMIDAFFAADTSTAFSIDAAAEAKHQIDADVGMNVVFEDAGTVFFGYTGTIRNGSSSHGVDIGMRVQF